MGFFKQVIDDGVECNHDWRRVPNNDEEWECKKCREEKSGRERIKENEDNLKQKIEDAMMKQGLEQCKKEMRKGEKVKGLEEIKTEVYHLEKVLELEKEHRSNQLQSIDKSISSLRQELREIAESMRVENYNRKMDINVCQTCALYIHPTYESHLCNGQCRVSFLINKPNDENCKELRRMYREKGIK